MTKVFKIIMNIVLILFIASFCALYIPPLLGITTAVANVGSETNMQAGSVAYGIREALSDLQNGERIIVSTDDSTYYIYEVESVDTSTGEIIVKSSDGSDTETIELRRTASKLVIVVPFIGYILLATQSFEGLVILCLVAALIIMLFIIASIINKKADSKEQENEESDLDYFKTLAASSNRPSSLDALKTTVLPSMNEINEGEDSNNSLSPETAAIDEDIEAITLIDEAVTLADEPITLADEPITLADKPVTLSDEVVTLADEAVTPSAQTDEITAPLPEIKEDELTLQPQGDNTVTAAPSNDETQTEHSKVGTETAAFLEIGDALENILSTEQINQPQQTPEVQAAAESHSFDDTEDEAVDGEMQSEIVLAIPIRTLDEMLEEAYANGEDPQVKKDPVTGIALVDYSSSLNVKAQ